MTYLETALAAFAVGGLAFAGFVFWLIWPRAEAVGSRSKPDIKPAE